MASIAAPVIRRARLSDELPTAEATPILLLAIGCESSW
jgi:hypothetical protein